MTLEKGIVLKTIDYQENSKILYIMTAKGLKSAIVRGAKSLRSIWATTQCLNTLLR